MFNIKEIKPVIQQISEARQLSEDALWEAVESAFAAAYKREYAKTDQIIRTRINRETGEFSFFQAKQVLSDEMILPEDEQPNPEEETRVRFNPERHITLEDARLVRHGITAGEELLFPLETRTDFGRIAAQSARQAITQKIHEAERASAISEFQGKEHTLVHGRVQRIDRRNVFIDLGKTVALLPFPEQIRGERFRQGDTIRAFVKSVDVNRRSDGFVMLSRSDPRFVVSLFKVEVPELVEGTLEVKAVARDAGVRTKIAVTSNDPSVDPVGSFVGQRGMRVMTVKNELGGEQVDIIHWSESDSEFVGESLLPAEVLEVVLTEENTVAMVKASDEQIPIAIGRGGQNLKLASILCGKKIVIINMDGVEIAEAYPDGQLTILNQDREKTSSATPSSETTSSVTEETITGEEDASYGVEDGFVEKEVAETPSQEEPSPQEKSEKDL